MDAISRRHFFRSASGAVVAAAGADQARAQRRAVRVFYDPVVLQHEPSRDHPERPARMQAALTAVRSLERDGRAAIAKPRAATEDDILLVHEPGYLKKVRAEVAEGRRSLSTGDTEISPGSLSSALAAAGAVLSAVDAVMADAARRALCVVRPPGHHASQARGMGFCVFNNIAIGARHALRRHGVERVLIADWDVHHGNGTQEVFWNDGSVLFFDTHQHPWYPGTGSANETGEGRGRGLIVNRPFPAGAGRGEIVRAFREVLVPAAERFKPQLVMVSAGFDSRAGDPLGQFTLTDADFGELTAIVAGLAEAHAGGRLVSVLEGGYALDGLTSALHAHLERLAT